MRCPWHGACFNVRTGDIEDAPTLGGLNTFPTHVANGKVYVQAADFKARQRFHACAADLHVNGERVVVIVGGGPAGVATATTLRERGFDGRIVLVSREPHAPYDRVKCSKSFGASAASIALRKEGFYAQQHIELVLGKEVSGVDTEHKSVRLSDGSTLAYTWLVLAPGADARTLPIPGSELANVRTLRTVDDAHAIDAACVGLNDIAVVGLSFIGTEVAAVLKSMKKTPNVTILGLEKVPLERVLGPEVGSAMQQLHETRGVQFVFEAAIERFTGDEHGRVSGVQLAGGRVVPAQRVIVDVGVRPATDFLKGAVVGALQRDGGVGVNEYLQVPGVDGVYALGDIARFPFHATGESVRIEHWAVAEQHGRVAALNIVAPHAPTPFRAVPFFWTVQYGKSLRYAGHATSYDSTHWVAGADAGSFAQYYVRGNQVLAVATLGVDALATAVAELMHQGRMPTADEIRAGLDPRSILTTPRA